ncbi:MAG: Fe(2+) transporter FeoB [Phycisphaerae bacterium]|nr:Fe(2+) transporter FeoB [Phycisphaerae bacterium]
MHPSDAPSAPSHHHATNPRAAAARIALVGNPNTGKTTLFNALTGFRRHVANYPGVTVEVAHGTITGTSVELLDLPGSYSLAANSPDEAVLLDALCGRIPGQPPPDAILAIVDASVLPRNLYLLSQVLEIGLPVVIALNMIDVAQSRGVAIDAPELSHRLGVPVVPVVATDPRTLPPLIDLLRAALPGQRTAASGPELPADLTRLRAALPAAPNPAIALRVLLDRDGAAPRAYLAAGGSRAALDAARRQLDDQHIDVAAEVRARYAWIGRLLDGVVTRPPQPVTTWTARLDWLLTHRVWGALVLALVLFVLFQSIFRWSQPLMDFISDRLMGSLAALATVALPEGAVRSLLVDGLIAGVGGVLVFLPQIMILFGLIAILEDSGYIARAAFMVDRIMRAAGLSGRSFIPLLSSFACAVPAIMGARVIADRRDRIVTILIAPFMSCSARLPVYVLMTSAFIPDRYFLGGWIGLRGLVMMGMYLIGVVVAIPVAWLLKKTVLAGPPPGFVLELPTYKLPRLRAVWQRMSHAGAHFISRAGTVILAVSIAVWALAYFPRSATTEQRVRATAVAAGWDESRTDAALQAEFARHSFLGRIGRALEPAIRPIGWDWRIGAAIVASFPAREVVVSSLGTIFSLGHDADEADLRGALAAATWSDSGRPLFTVSSALALMVFFALCAQCASTLVMIGRETGNWLWPVASFSFMTAVAYVAALLTAVIARGLGCDG